MAKTIPVLDLAFFLMEKKSSPTHVAALMLFKLPASAGKRFVADLAAAYRKCIPVPPFNYVPEFPALRMPRWVEADTVDMKYHVRHTALPASAAYEDFLDLVAELHTQLLDRKRPCFRAYFIEGLPDRQFALYAKMHHAIVDGASAIARITASLDESPDARAVRPFFTIDFGGGAPHATSERRSALAALKSTAVRQTIAVKDVYANVLRKSISRKVLGAGSVPFKAPRAPMNEPIQVGREVATLSLPLQEMKAIGKAFGGTLNDVALTIVDAALHRYLGDRSLGLANPLVALCPLSLREAGDREATTKASIMFVPLGKRKNRIATRMEHVMQATRSAKAEVLGMGKDAAIIYSLLAFGLSDAAIASGANAVTGPLANFVVSNVPGPRSDLSLGGAKMQAVYPISGLPAGVGLNVTLISYSDSMDFGFVANAASMPDLARLAQYTREAFLALTRAAARRPIPAAAPRTKSVPTGKSVAAAGGRFASRTLPR